MADLDPNHDPSLPVLRIAVEGRQPGQVVMPMGFLGIFPGDSCEVVAEPHTIRIDTYIVTDEMRDADKVRFAATEQLFEENRVLQAQVSQLQAQLLDRTEVPTEPRFLGPPLESNPEGDSKDST